MSTNCHVAWSSLQCQIQIVFCVTLFQQNQITFVTINGGQGLCIFLVRLGSCEVDIFLLPSCISVLVPLFALRGTKLELVREENVLVSLGVKHDLVLEQKNNLVPLVSGGGILPHHC